MGEDRPSGRPERPGLTDHPPLRSYGRIKARPIKPRQAGLLDTLLPKLAIPDGPVHLSAANEVWLEIGFGGGEHMAARAERDPNVLILGAEPFLNGVASALRHIDEHALAISACARAMRANSWLTCPTPA